MNLPLLASIALTVAAALSGVAVAGPRPPLELHRVHADGASRIIVNEATRDARAHFDGSRASGREDPESLGGPRSLGPDFTRFVDSLAPGAWIFDAGGGWSAYGAALAKRGFHVVTSDRVDLFGQLVYPLSDPSRLKGLFKRRGDRIYLEPGKHDSALNLRAVIKIADALGVPRPAEYRETQRIVEYEGRARWRLESAESSTTILKNLAEFFSRLRAAMEARRADRSYERHVGWSQDRLAAMADGSVSAYLDVNGSFLHSSDRLEQLHAIYRKLAPGGRAYLLADGLDEDVVHGRDGVRAHLHRYLVDHAAGLIREYQVGIYPGPPDAIVVEKPAVDPPARLPIALTARDVSVDRWWGMSGHVPIPAVSYVEGETGEPPRFHASDHEPVSDAAPETPAPPPEGYLEHALVHEWPPAPVGGVPIVDVGGHSELLSGGPLSPVLSRRREQTRARVMAEYRRRKTHLLGESDFAKLAADDARRDHSNVFAAVRAPLDPRATGDAEFDQALWGAIEFVRLDRGDLPFLSRWTEWEANDLMNSSVWRARHGQATARGFRKQLLERRFLNDRLAELSRIARVARGAPRAVAPALIYRAFLEARNPADPVDVIIMSFDQGMHERFAHLPLEEVYKFTLGEKGETEYLMAIRTHGPEFEEALRLLREEARQAAAKDLIRSGRRAGSGQ